MKQLKFKVGDTVIVNGEQHGKHFSNAIGKVLCMSRLYEHNMIGVEFIQFIDGHQCISSGVEGKDGYCWDILTHKAKKLSKLKLKKLLEG